MSDGPDAPGAADGAPGMRVGRSEGPRFDLPPERPDGPSTFIVAKTDTCVWCQKTMDFLKALHEERGDFQVAVLDANEQREAFQRMVQHTRRTTVPQVFLDGRFVGGWNELAVAARKGQLDAYLDGEPWQAAPGRRRFRRSGTP